MSEQSLTVEHVLQPALLVRDMDQALDKLHAMFGIFPSERVDITFSGVNNAVYAFQNGTYLELIEPYDPRASAGRLMERFGEGWHMVSVDLQEMPVAEVELLLDSAGVRVVHHDRAPRLKGGWHLHPRDCGGVLLAAFIRENVEDNSAFAGKPFREYIGTNTRVVHAILGISLVTDNLEQTRELYTALGFQFGEESNDAGDRVLQAITPKGTFLQLRSPESDAAPSAAQLKKRGPGQFHIVFDADDLAGARARIEAVGIVVTRETVVDGRPAFWTEPATTFGVPFELRQRR